MTSVWKSGSCFGQSDYQDLLEVVVPWTSDNGVGSYQAAVDVEDEGNPATAADIPPMSFEMTRISEPPASQPPVTFHPLSPRSYRSSSPSARRWRQIKHAGLSLRRRLNSRYPDTGFTNEMRSQDVKLLDESLLLITFGKGEKKTTSAGHCCQKVSRGPEMDFVGIPRYS